MSAPSQALPSANDMLSGGSRRYRSLSFNAPEPPVEYRDLEVLAEPETWQDKDDKTGAPLYWDATKRGVKTTERYGPNGEPNPPIPVYSVKLQLPDGFRPSKRIVDEYGIDNGERFLYFSGSMKRGSGSSFDAIATACQRGGAKRGLQPGGILRRFAWVAGGESDGAMSTHKVYEAEYDPSGERPAAGSANGRIAQEARVRPDDDGNRGAAYTRPTDDSDLTDEPPF